MDLLRLIALDTEDLDVVSAHMQDAVMKVGDLEFDARAHRFALAANRFVREEGVRSWRRHHERRRVSLHFNRVLGVRFKGFRPDDGHRVLALLAVQFFPDGVAESPGGEIELIFAEDASVLMTVECIEAQLADLGPAWETPHRPRHPDTP